MHARDADGDAHRDPRRRHRDRRRRAAAWLQAHPSDRRACWLVEAAGHASTGATQPGGPTAARFALKLPALTASRSERRRRRHPGCAPASSAVDAGRGRPGPPTGRTGRRPAPGRDGRARHPARTGSPGGRRARSPAPRPAASGASRRGGRAGAAVAGASPASSRSAEVTCRRPAPGMSSRTGRQRLERLGRHRAGADDGQLGAGLGRQQPVAAGQDRRRSAPASSRARAGAIWRVVSRR